MTGDRTAGVIDFHAHMPARRAAGFLVGADFGPEQFVAYLDAAGVAVGVVLTHDGLYHPSPAENDALAAFVAHCPHRMIALGTVDPRLPAAAAEARRCFTELGMRGLKFHPWLQGFSPHEPFLDPICEAAAEHGALLTFHDGTPPYATPLQIAALARRHPRVPVVLAHGGLHDCWREALVAVREVDNVYVCLCGTPPYAARRIAAAAPAHKVLFGSDAGLSASGEQAYAIARVEELTLWGVPADRLRRIAYDNAARLLGLS